MRTFQAPTAALLALFATALLAAPDAGEHEQHHPSAAKDAPTATSAATGLGMMEMPMMKDHMKAMRDHMARMHDAKSGDERAKLEDEHMTMMMDHMDMMMRMMDDKEVEQNGDHDRGK